MKSSLERFFGPRLGQQGVTARVPAGKPAIPKLLRYVATGLLNTAFGYAMYAGLVFVGLPYVAALLLATIAGTVFNYFSFGGLVFNGRGGRETFLRFIAAYAAIYVANAAALQALTAGAGVGPYVAQVACIPLSVALGWVFMNRWVFRQCR